MKMQLMIYQKQVILYSHVILRICEALTQLSLHALMVWLSTELYVFT
jgi:hypothetical protein